MNAIQKSFTDKLFANYEANVKYQAIENAASHNGIFAALERRQSHVDNTPVFSLDLTKDKVTNQKASGRCWMFAALNTFRHKLIRIRGCLTEKKRSGMLLKEQRKAVWIF